MSKEPQNHTDKPIYENYILQTPDGRDCAVTNKKRIMWYLKRDLVEQVDDKIYRFKFMPNGISEDDEFDITLRENKCAQCGTSDKLSKHHTVPYEFRRLFPIEYKDRSSVDIVPMCRKHHDDYEILANEERERLFNLYCTEEIEFNKRLNKIKKFTRDGLNFEMINPEDWNYRNGEIKNFIYKYGMSRAEILEAQKYNLAQVVIDKMGIEELIIHWKNHFINSVDLPYLPKNFDANRVFKANDRKELPLKLTYNVTGLLTIPIIINDIEAYSPEEAQAVAKDMIEEHILPGVVGINHTYDLKSIEKK